MISAYEVMKPFSTATGALSMVAWLAGAVGVFLARGRPLMGHLGIFFGGHFLLSALGIVMNFLPIGEWHLWLNMPLQLLRLACNGVLVVGVFTVGRSLAAPQAEPASSRTDAAPPPGA